MAIAGIVISAPQERLAGLRGLLLDLRGVLEVREVAEAGKLAVVLESPSHSLQRDLEYVNGLPHVLMLDVAFINYEDDLDSQGHMPCPPHRAKEHCLVPAEDEMGTGRLQ